MATASVQEAIVREIREAKKENREAEWEYKFQVDPIRYPSLSIRLCLIACPFLLAVSLILLVLSSIWL